MEDNEQARHSENSASKLQVEAEAEKLQVSSKEDNEQIKGGNKDLPEIKIDAELSMFLFGRMQNEMIKFSQLLNDHDAPSMVRSTGHNGTG